MSQPHYLLSDTSVGLVVPLSKNGRPTAANLEIRVTLWGVAQEIVTQAKDAVANMDSAPQLVQSLIGSLEGFLGLADIIAEVCARSVYLRTCAEPRCYIQVNTYAKLALGIIKSSSNVCSTLNSIHLCAEYILGDYASNRTGRESPAVSCDCRKDVRLRRRRPSDRKGAKPSTHSGTNIPSNLRVRSFHCEVCDGYHLIL